nr:reverse transcriptase domain-containing protein [Tanacetum cinerariifolium]
MLEFFSSFRISDTLLELDAADTLCFQLFGARRSMSWRQFILALGLHTIEEMVGAGFDGYWADSLREIATKDDLSAPKKRTTRTSPATITATTPVTSAQLKALIDQDITDALAARDASRNDVPEESDKIEKYVGGLPDKIYGSVMVSKPKIMQDAIEFATELMDKKISTLAERQAENKRKLDNNNQAQQQPPKKQGVAIAYTAGPGEREESPVATNNQRNLTFYECGNQGHYKSDCPKLKNQNHRNQAEGVARFGKWGKLNPKDARPFKVLEKVRAIAYKLELPQEFSRVHHTFHEGLWGLTLVVGELRVINIDELVRLQICEGLRETWAWVAPGPERQHMATAGAARRMERLEEEVRGVRESLREQRAMLDAMSRDFSRDAPGGGPMKPAPQKPHW